MENEIVKFVRILITTTLLTAASIRADTPPFCPCFTQDEVDHAWDRNLSTHVCTDDRSIVEGVDQTAETVMKPNEFDFATVAVKTNNGGATWGCILFPGINTPVWYPDIGFTNAMACRLTIINSVLWDACLKNRTSP